MLDAFPLDVWVGRAVAEQYGPGFDPAVFRPYAGVAQQYIFYYARRGSLE
jgi:N-glycosylase/DNA lyase